MALQRVETDAIQDDAVTTAKIAANAVAAADIAADAITNIKVAAGAAIAVSKITGLGTAATLTAGTAANNVVQLDGSARLPAVNGANLTGVSTDTSAIENNVAILAFKTQAANDLAKFNLVDQVIDEYKDATGVTLTTAGQTGSTAADGYLSSVSSSVGAFTSDANTQLLMHFDDSALTTDSGNTGHTMTNSGAARNGTYSKYGSYSAYFNGSSVISAANHADWSYGTGDLTVEFWARSDNLSANDGIYDFNKYSTGTPVITSTSTGGGSFAVQVPSGGTITTAGSNNTWYHIAFTRQSGTYRLYKDGVQTHSGSWSGSQSSSNGIAIGNYYNGGYGYNGYLDELRVSNINRYPNGTTFTPNSVTTTSATGTATSTANTALTAPTTGDIVLLIENASGTATLNTDLKAYVSRNGGTGWDQATLVDKGTWGTNKKILVANNVAFSNSASGTDMRYKIEWANQAAGSKVTKVHATSLAWA